MDISDMIALLGGVALFLFGMSLMGKGLNKVAGNRLEVILYRLSNTALKGMLLGTGVTAVIQSSSATSVMVVGFVNSGIMKVRQAIAVILGALIGTSITGWIICLSSIEGSGRWVSLLSTSTISALVAIIGIILHMASRKPVNRYVGDILLGFAVLMFGMHSMSDAVEPLRESERFIRVMTNFSNPLLGVLVGAAFAAILQSGSAAVGILQALSTTGVISFAVAFPMILGIGMGASVPVLLSGLSAKVSGRRCALSYLIIELIGAVLCGTVFYCADAIWDLALNDRVMTPVSVAAVNTIFHAITSISLLPFVGGLEKLVSLLVREKEGGRDAVSEFDRLDERFLRYPAIAVEQCGITVNSMALRAKENALLAVRMLDEYSDDCFAAMEQSEDMVDRSEEKLNAYLEKINALALSPDESRQVSKYLHTLSDLELISDHAMNIAKTAREIHEKQIRFPEDEKREMSVLSEALPEILELTFAAYTGDSAEQAYRVEPLESCIGTLCTELKRRHIARLQNSSFPSTGFTFNAVLSEIERVADHCSNIAITLIELQSGALNAGTDEASPDTLRGQDFESLYSYYLDKYSLQ